MLKKLASSHNGTPPRKRAFRSVDQVFSHYFPASGGSRRSKLRVRESGSELAERVFAQITKLKDV
jgi:hypothetical protein